MRVRDFIGTAIAIMSCTGISVASAAPRSKGPVLILQIEHDGLSADLVGLFGTALRGEAQKVIKAKLLPEPKMDFSSMQLTAGCVDADADCLASIGQMLGAVRVIRTQLSGTPRQLDLIITSVRVRGKKKKTTKAEMKGVDVESVEEFRYNVARALGAKRRPLTGAIELVEVQAGSLLGAKVLLDDQKVAVSALSDLKPGTHRLEIHQIGFETFIRMPEVRPARVTSIEVELKKTKTTPSLALTKPKPKPKVDAAATAPVYVDEGPKLLFTYVVAGGAVLATVVGIAFFGQGKGAQNDLVDLRARDAASHKACDEAVKGGSTNLPVNCVDVKDAYDNISVAETGTLVSFVTAGVLGGATILTFFLEDGHKIFTGSSKPTKKTTSWNVVPLKGGGAAAVTVRF